MANDPDKQRPHRPSVGAQAAARLRREAHAARRRRVREMTPGERMELAYRLFELTRADA